MSSLYLGGRIVMMDVDGHEGIISYIATIQHFVITERSSRHVL